MISKDELEETYEKFLVLADGKKEISDDDILQLLGKDITKRQLCIKELKVSCGTEKPATANIKIDIDGEIHEAYAEGNGPLDAAKNAIDKIIKKDVRLEEYLVQAVTGGSDDYGKVHIQIKNRKDGVFHYGFGSDTDVIFASAQAYLEAVNKA